VVNLKGVTRAIYTLNMSHASTQHQFSKLDIVTRYVRSRDSESSF